MAYRDPAELNRATESTTSTRRIPVPTLVHARAWSSYPGTRTVPTLGEPAARPRPDLTDDLPYGRIPLPPEPLVPMRPVAPVPRALLGPRPYPRKSSAVGVAASFVLPGTGSVINGSPGRGTLIFSLWLLAFLLDLTIIGLLIGLPLGFVAWVWGLVDGAASADRYNHRVAVYFDR